MAQKPLSRALLQQAVNAYAEAGTFPGAAALLGIPRNTVQSRVHAARQAGVKPNGGRHDPNDVQAAQAEIKRLKAENAKLKEDALTAETIRRAILSLAADVDKTSPPSWTVDTKTGHKSPGVPTLFISDLHHGEVVHASQVNGVNSYNLKIAHKRLDTLADSTVRLLRILSPDMDYPGIVLMLGGDMVSGNIHDELATTNEINTMPTVLDLFGKLASFILTMADTFGHVFVVGVTGNHGRDTHKIWTKDRHHTSFDWLLYCFLAKHFEKDKRITFLIPDGPDAYFKLYNHRYLLTHGDQFRGGDGLIGALGPIIRGDHKKRSRNGQIGMEYDTMCCGHWHSYMHLTRLIVNGSLKGYDEYAYSNNFPFERPQQALWLTHPKYGITYRMPVYVEEPVKVSETNWVSVPK